MAALLLGMASGVQAQTAAAVPPLLFAQGTAAELPPPPPPSYAPLPAGRFLDPARGGSGKTGFRAIDKSQAVGSNRAGPTEKRLAKSKIQQHGAAAAGGRGKKSH